MKGRTGVRARTMVNPFILYYSNVQTFTAEIQSPDEKRAREGRSLVEKWRFGKQASREKNSDYVILPSMEPMIAGTRSDDRKD